ncbi:MAG: YabP/YqfC family sporulation protein [Oscillospiraceae bacterium]|nr:YabP/YqfC family sporulation protein [Oscillospiraceae bacterium]
MAAEIKAEVFSDERIHLEGRRVLRATGVKEILRFDETTVVLRLTERLLVVRGAGLSLRSLVPEDGQVELRGRVDALGYEQGGQEKGLFRRLFG